MTGYGEGEALAQKAIDAAEQYLAAERVMAFALASIADTLLCIEKQLEAIKYRLEGSGI